MTLIFHSIQTRNEIFTFLHFETGNDIHKLIDDYLDADENTGVISRYTRLFLINKIIQHEYIKTRVNMNLKTMIRLLELNDKNIFLEIFKHIDINSILINFYDEQRTKHPEEIR